MENVAQSAVDGRKAHQFKPGNPGGPGRPRKSQAVRELERVSREQATAVLEKLAGPALRVLQKALAGKDTALAVRAAIDVLDRTQGRAVQRVDANISESPAAVNVSPEMLKLAAQRLLAASAEDASEVRDADR